LAAIFDKTFNQSDIPLTIINFIDVRSSEKVVETRASSGFVLIFSHGCICEKVWYME